ncbi:MAG TPA: RHS repeat-associated core domain-containing protein [Ktedonosporobacter sp.]|jgi:RHS repeat-associated protein|nr:RHS repeat-associated core domain-containing protein [Ktedonosporobacter sp.]
MTCRAPSSATTCSGTQTGQQLNYDAEGHLSTWQNQPTPTSTVNYLYDGEGSRVASQLVNGGNTTLTSYIGNLETVVTGSSTTTTTYYTAGALRIAEAVNGTFSYLGNDVLGSTAVALNASGQLTAAQLYGPYGNVRYSSGTMPTDIGFTGQRGDSATGLDYYGARYYDPVVGLFISADTVLPGNGFDPWGLSRYAYVQGNPETMTDPTGHWGFWSTVAAAVVVVAAVAVISLVAAPLLVGMGAMVVASLAADATAASIVATATTASIVATATTAATATAAVGVSVTAVSAASVTGQIIGDRLDGKWSTSDDIVSAAFVNSAYEACGGQSVANVICNGYSQYQQARQTNQDARDKANLQATVSAQATTISAQATTIAKLTNPIQRPNRPAEARQKAAQKVIRDYRGNWGAAQRVYAFAAFQIAVQAAGDVWSAPIITPWHTRLQ